MSDFTPRFRQKTIEQEPNRVLGSSFHLILPRPQDLGLQQAHNLAGAC
jgi:hypothetical protein